MLLRTARMDDADMLLQWRNDPQTRAMSISSAIVERDEHVAWLARSLVNPERKIIIAILQSHDLAVGTGRFEMVDDSIELSWTIAPAFRGLGFGRVLLRDLVLAAPPCDLFARIKPENAPSRRMVEGCHFAYAGTEDGLDIWARPGPKAARACAVTRGAALDARADGALALAP